MSFIPTWAACRETLIGHLELHGAVPYSLDGGIHIRIVQTPLHINSKVLVSSMFDNGPWTLTHVGHPDSYQPRRIVDWAVISDDMLRSLEIPLIEQFLSTTR